MQFVVCLIERYLKASLNALIDSLQILHGNRLFTKEMWTNFRMPTLLDFRGDERNLIISFVLN